MSRSTFSFIDKQTNKPVTTDLRYTCNVPTDGTMSKDRLKCAINGDFAEKRVLKLVECFSGHCHAIKNLPQTGLQVEHFAAF